MHIMCSFWPVKAVFRSVLDDSLLSPPGPKSLSSPDDFLVLAMEGIRRAALVARKGRAPGFLLLLEEKRN